MAIDMPCVGGGTPVALLREVISVDLSLPFVALPCFPPRMASKQEQQLPMMAIQVSGGVEAGRGAAVGRRAISSAGVMNCMTVCWRWRRLAERKGAR